MAFEPIIGGGFDQIAAQRQFWANFNNQVATANIGRANAQEENWNNWLRDNARAMEIARSQGLEQARFADTLAAQAAREDLAAEMQAQRLEEERVRTESVENIAAARMELAAKKQAFDLNKQGEHAAYQYGLRLNAAREAEKAKLDADRRLEKMQALKAQIDTRITEAGKKAGQSDLAMQTQLGASIKALQKELPKFTTATEKAGRELTDYSASLTAKGFTVDLPSQRIVHPSSQATWSFGQAVNAAAKAALPPLAGTPSVTNAPPAVPTMPLPPTAAPLPAPAPSMAQLGPPTLTAAARAKIIQKANEAIQLGRPRQAVIDEVQKRYGIVLQ